MKMQGWQERVGVGIVGLVLGLIVMVSLMAGLDLFGWYLFLIPPVFMVLAMIIGDPVIDFLSQIINYDRHV